MQTRQELVVAQDVEILLQIAIRVAAAVGAVESGTERSLVDELADVEGGFASLWITAATSRERSCRGPCMKRGKLRESRLT